MAQSLVQLEFKLGHPGSIPGSHHYSIDLLATLGKLFTHVASRGAPIMLWPIIGAKLSADYRLFISGRIFVHGTIFEIE